VLLFDELERPPELVRDEPAWLLLLLERPLLAPILLPLRLVFLVGILKPPSNPRIGALNASARNRFRLHGGP
jgi:hypothetical protein